MAVRTNADSLVDWEISAADLLADNSYGPDKPFDRDDFNNRFRKIFTSDLFTFRQATILVLSFGLWEFTEYYDPLIINRDEYDFGVPPGVIAKYLGISNSRVSSVKQKMIERLREHSVELNLCEFLGYHFSK